MVDIEAFTIFAKAITLVAGGFVTLLAYRAYARTGSPALRALALGLALVTFGALVGGAVHQFTALGLVVGVAIQSAFTALGFTVLAYSLYVTHSTDEQSIRRARAT